MKKLTVLFVICFVAASAVAQATPTPPPQGQLYLLEVDHVKPSGVATYEAGIKQILPDFANGLNATPDMPGFATWSSDDFRYASLIRLDNVADLDRVYKGMQAVMDRIGKAKMDQLDTTIGPAYNYTHRYLLREMPEWSYTTPNDPLDVTMTPNCLVQEFYFNPGSENKMDTFGRAFRALMVQKKVPHSYIVYRGGLGTEQPMVTVVNCAKTMAQLSANDEADTKAAPEREQMINRDLLPMLRKVVRFHAMYRPELSVVTAKDKAAMQSHRAPAPPQP